MMTRSFHLGFVLASTLLALHSSEGRLAANGRGHDSRVPKDDMPPTCSNGLVGLEKSGVCCRAECGVCGEVGCSDRGGGLGQDDCCTSNILEDGVDCDVSGSAPCIVAPPDDEPMCSNGIPGVEGFGSCCKAACGTCGGRGCRQRAVEAGLTAHDCCVQQIRQSHLYCDDGQHAPCMLGSEPVCSSNGLPGLEEGNVCCAPGCTVCGDEPVCRREAKISGLLPGQCCKDHIMDAQKYCDDTSEAPCILGSAKHT